MTTKTKKPTKKTKKAPKKPKYRLEVEVNGNKFETGAEDMETALSEFVESPEFPLGAKTLAIFRYSDGKIERIKVLHTPEARRLFKIISLKPDALAVYAKKLTEDLA